MKRVLARMLEIGESLFLVLVFVLSYVVCSFVFLVGNLVTRGEWGRQWDAVLEQVED